MNDHHEYLRKPLQNENFDSLENFMNPQEIEMNRRLLEKFKDSSSSNRRRYGGGGQNREYE